ncbi:MAG: MGMT family protein [bacterium]
MMTMETPWGRLNFDIGPTGVVSSIYFDGPAGAPLEEPYASALRGYLAGQPIPLELPVDLSSMPAFTRRVLLACREIPFGTTVSYGELATIIGKPKAARAVGQALGRNPIPVIIPCHRVIGHNGSLTGFGGGLEWKRKLLEHEGILMDW